MLTRGRLAATAAAIALLLVAPAGAQGAKIKTGFYDCLGPSGTYLDYKGSVHIKSKGRYNHGFGRTGKKLEGGKPGKYKVKGKKLKFKGGSMAKTPGKITSKTSFDVYVKKQFSGVTCYRVKNP